MRFCHTASLLHPTHTYNKILSDSSFCFLFGSTSYTHLQCAIEPKIYHRTLWIFLFQMYCLNCIWCNYISACSCTTQISVSISNFKSLFFNQCHLSLTSILPPHLFLKVSVHNFAVHFLSSSLFLFCIPLLSTQVSVLARPDISKRTSQEFNGKLDITTATNFHLRMYNFYSTPTKVLTGYIKPDTNVDEGA